MDRSGSIVPFIPLRNVGEFIRRIEYLKAFTDRAGYGSIAYFLDIALSEARYQPGGAQPQGERCKAL
jgi:hypothetical protein